jgi:hypothetical protein
MRKYFYLSILLFGFSFCFAANVPIYKENTVKYKGIEAIKTYNLYNKKGNPACRLKINFFYPESLSDKLLLNKLQSIFVNDFFGKEYEKYSPKEAVKTYSNVYLEEYKSMFETSELYKREIDHTVKKNEDIKDFAFLYTFTKTIRNTIMFNKGNIISQVINEYEYKGGAHGATSTKGMVIDMDTGQKLKYEEIFYNNTEDAVSALLFSYLMSSRNYTRNEELVAEGFYGGFIHPTNNFIADDQGITFIYNPYELGTYVLGTVEIMVPYTDLAIYMKPNGILFRWAQNKIAGNRIKYETSELTKEYSASGMEDFPFFSADIQFTYPVAYFEKTILRNIQKQFITNAFGNTFADIPVQSVTAAFYESLLDNYKAFVDSNKELSAQILTEKDEDKAASLATCFIKDYTQKNTFFFNWDNLISYVIETSQYEEMNVRKTFTEKGFIVYLKTGNNLVYNDIFQPGFQKEISLLLVNKLLKDKGLVSVTQLTDNGYDVDNITPTDNFYINEEGMVFIYNFNKMETQESDIIKILLPYSEITQWIKPDSPLLTIKQE